MSIEKIYDAKNVSVVVDGRVVQGFQDNDMVTATQKEENVQTAVDAQGEAQITINNNKLGQITINLSGNSADHKRLNKLANTKKVFPVTIKSDIEKVTAQQCIISKPADAAYGKAVPGRTYTIEALEIHIEAV